MAVLLNKDKKKDQQIGMGQPAPAPNAMGAAPQAPVVPKPQNTSGQFTNTQKSLQANTQAAQRMAQGITGVMNKQANQASAQATEQASAFQQGVKAAQTNLGAAQQLVGTIGQPVAQATNLVNPGREHGGPVVYKDPSQYGTPAELYQKALDTKKAMVSAQAQATPTVNDFTNQNWAAIANDPTLLARVQAANQGTIIDEKRMGNQLVGATQAANAGLQATQGIAQGFNTDAGRMQALQQYLGNIARTGQYGAGAAAMDQALLQTDTSARDTIAKLQGALQGKARDVASARQGLLSSGATVDDLLKKETELQKDTSKKLTEGTSAMVGGFEKGWTDYNKSITDITNKLVKKEALTDDEITMLKDSGVDMNTLVRGASPDDMYTMVANAISGKGKQKSELGSLLTAEQEANRQALAKILGKSADELIDIDETQIGKKGSPFALDKDGLTKAQKDATVGFDAYTNARDRLKEQEGLIRAVSDLNKPRIGESGTSATVNQLVEKYGMTPAQAQDFINRGMQDRNYWKNYLNELGRISQSYSQIINDNDAYANASTIGKVLRGNK
jgi:hypothetical protein